MRKEDLERLARMRACGRHTWQEIADHLGTSWNAARNQWRRKARKLKPGLGPCPLCQENTEGVGEEGPVWEEKGNYAEARTQGGRVRSLPELLEVVKPDLTIWQVLDWGVKKWEVGAKIKEGHLEWDQGRIDGYLDYKGLGREELWSVWAKFVRREPVPIYPVIQPVQCDAVYPPPPPPVNGSIKRGLLLPDVQMGFTRGLRDGKLYPFHDRRALDLTVQIATGIAFDVIVLLGDFQDLVMLTDKFIRSPQFYFTTQPAILEGHYYLRRLREAAPGARIVLLQGNHEERMDKILTTHLLEACGLRAADELHLPPALSVPRLLALHELGVEWIGDYPEGEVWLGPLRCLHGDRASQVPGGTARAVVGDTDQNTAFGHIHRIEMVSRRTQTREGWRTVRTFSPGCLCHIDGRVPGSKASDNWQQGLGVVEYTETSYTATPVEITEGEAIYGGSVWRGADYTASLRDTWPDWNW